MLRYGTRAPLALIAALAPASAAAGPDLVVAPETRVVFVGCGLEEPLAAGEAIIENIGDESARLPLGVLERYSRSLVLVYAPGYLDISDHGRRTTRLEAGERALLDFAVGAGSQKAARLGARSPEPEDRVPLGSIGQEAVAELQRALADLGYYDGAVDGLAGPQFRAAIRMLQARLEREPTGALVILEAEALQELTGRVLWTGAAAGGAIEATLHVVVDPYNLIAEDDETNNIAVFTGAVVCP